MLNKGADKIEIQMAETQISPGQIQKSKKQNFVLTRGRSFVRPRSLQSPPQETYLYPLQVSTYNLWADKRLFSKFFF